jgi:hypothetical protein
MSQLAFNQRFGNAVSRIRQNTHNQVILGMSNKFRGFWNVGTGQASIKNQHRSAINNMMWK